MSNVQTASYYDTVAQFSVCRDKSKYADIFVLDNHYTTKDTSKSCDCGCFPSLLNYSFASCISLCVIYSQHSVPFAQVKENYKLL